MTGNEGRVIDPNSDEWLKEVATQVLGVSGEGAPAWLIVYRKRERVLKHIFSGCEYIADAAAQAQDERGDTGICTGGATGAE